MSGSQRQTWVDWGIPAPSNPEQLLTIAELLAVLAQRGAQVVLGDLRYWQSLGAIPYSIRRRHNGATRALYPPQMVDVVLALRALQREGIRLRVMRKVMLTLAPDFSLPLTACPRCNGTGCVVAAPSEAA